MSVRAHDTLNRIDTVRVRKAEKEALEATKEGGVMKRQLKRKHDDAEIKDTAQYDAGAF